MQKKYRHELKYLVDERDLVLLEDKLKSIMMTDKHYENGAYEIRSAYFDDYRDSALNQNLMGVSPRFKYRIRIYNGDSSYIHLEKKIKNHDMTRKESCRLSYEECRRLLSGQYQIQPEDEMFLKQFKAYAAMNLLKPKMIVAYERKAFICPDGNIRITFDRNISSVTDIEQFFSQDIVKRPIMESGKHVLEVKYDEFMPRYIKETLNDGKLDRTTYSKYYLCRKYSIGT
ncbi:MAG: polyphosphate polymerase domain-containing protein [Lachnospiraceae bacterium]|nr:polyphosphate polymerase domain-containing protein [Lachnospiraceae bacterium]